MRIIPIGVLMLSAASAQYVPPGGSGGGGATCGTPDCTVNGTLAVTGNTTIGSVFAENLLVPVVATVSAIAVDNSQKQIAKDFNGFMNWVYVDSDALFLGVCGDIDCATYTSILVADASGGSISQPMIAIPSGGLPHISYVKNAGPNEIHHAVCNKFGCSSNNVVATGNFFEHGFGLDSNGFGLHSWTDYTDHDNKVLSCTNLACSAHTTAQQFVAGTFGFESAIAQGANGFPIIAYINDKTPPTTVNLVQCTNAGCSTKLDTVVDQVGSVGYYVDMVRDGSGRGQIVYNGVGGSWYAQCTSDDCSSVSKYVIDSSTASNQVSVMMGGDGFGRVALENPADVVVWVQCTDLSCSTKHTRSFSEGGAVIVSLALGPDGFARILNVNNASKQYYIMRFENDAGTPVVSPSLVPVISNAKKYWLNGVPLAFVEDQNYGLSVAGTFNAINYSAHGLGGLNATLTVKGSDGNNCAVTISGGIATATTCP